MAARNARVVALSLAVVVAMGALVAASVPLYRLFCAATGYNGTPRIGALPSTTREAREVTVRFDASVARGMPWRFAPEQTALRVRLGDNALALFRAENPTDHAITGTATFNVTPAKAAQYVNKIACFCFTEQRLAAHQTAEMPVSFFIDPKIADDPDTRDVGTVTLSYTFFDTADQSRADAADGKGRS